jgi:2-phospho-L-lactate guanylyltransferase
MTTSRTPADLSRTWAIVPVRGLEGAKSRLGGQLDAEERLDLVTRLLERVIAAACASTRLAGTIVVSPDPAALELAVGLGAVGHAQTGGGLDAGLDDGRTAAVAAGATAILVLPADLPAVDGDAIDELLGRTGAQASASPTGLVALVTDRHGSGTNALLLSPPSVIDFAFGPGSRTAHRRAAEEGGASYLELDGALSLDLDTPDDLVLVERLLPRVVDAR